jgi:hypothetical protein
MKRGLGALGMGLPIMEGLEEVIIIHGIITTWIIY